MNCPICDAELNHVYIDGEDYAVCPYSSCGYSAHIEGEYNPLGCATSIVVIMIIVISMIVGLCRWWQDEW